MSILEYEDIGEGTPQGVVLALVGPEPDAPLGTSNGHQESLRTLRMYNLTSLMSLAKWTIAQKVCISPFFLFAVFSPASHRALILWISAELPTGTSSKHLLENTVQQAVLHVGSNTSSILQPVHSNPPRHTNPTLLFRMLSGRPTPLRLTHHGISLTIFHCVGPPISCRSPVLVPDWQVRASFRTPCGTEVELDLAEAGMDDGHSSP